MQRWSKTDDTTLASGCFRSSIDMYFRITKFIISYASKAAADAYSISDGVDRKRENF